MLCDAQCLLPSGRLRAALDTGGRHPDAAAATCCPVSHRSRQQVLHTVFSLCWQACFPGMQLPLQWAELRFWQA